MPRIIAGKLKGMNLLAPRGTTSRPTSDRAKEALFSIIGDDIESMRVLDVFAGSGQIALEALSRGAKHATLIERDRDAMAAIEKNIEKTRLSDQTTVLSGDYRRSLSFLQRRGEQFDLIYLDPPWKLVEVFKKTIVDVIPNLLAKDGLLVIESERNKPVLEWPDASLTRLRSCQYGISVLSFYQCKPLDIEA